MIADKKEAFIKSQITGFTESADAYRIMTEASAIEKLVDKYMNSDIGSELAVAWDDGDWDKAEQVLSREKIKSRDVAKMLKFMFG